MPVAAISAVATAVTLVTAGWLYPLSQSNDRTGTGEGVHASPIPDLRAAAFPQPLSALQALGEGRDLLASLQSRSTDIGAHTGSSRWSVCWHNALQELSSGCVRANDQDKARLAIELTNCHLAQSGLAPIPCDSSSTLQSCTSAAGANPVAFSAYTTFFTHTDTMCSYLEADVWAEESRNLLVQVLEASTSTVESMTSLTSLALATHTQLTETSEAISGSLEAMTGSLKEIGESSQMMANQLSIASETTKSLISGQEALGQRLEDTHRHTSSMLEGVASSTQALGEDLSTSLDNEAHLLELQNLGLARMELLTGAVDAAVNASLALAARSEAMLSGLDELVMELDAGLLGSFMRGDWMIYDVLASVGGHVVVAIVAWTISLATLGASHPWRPSLPACFFVQAAYVAFELGLGPLAWDTTLALRFLSTAIGGAFLLFLRGKGGSGDPRLGLSSGASVDWQSLTTAKQLEESHAETMTVLRELQEKVTVLETMWLGSQHTKDADEDFVPCRPRRPTSRRVKGIK